MKKGRKMRAHLKFVTLLLMAGVVGCTGNGIEQPGSEIEGQDPNQMVRISGKAVIDGAGETRVSPVDFDADVVQLKWDAGDKLVVYSSSDPDKYEVYTLVGEGGTGEQVFEGLPVENADRVLYTYLDDYKTLPGMAMLKMNSQLNCAAIQKYDPDGAYIKKVLSCSGDLKDGKFVLGSDCAIIILSLKGEAVFNYIFIEHETNEGWRSAGALSFNSPMTLSPTEQKKFYIVVSVTGKEKYKVSIRYDRDVPLMEKCFTPNYKDPEKRTEKIIDMSAKPLTVTYGRGTEAVGPTADGDTRTSCPWVQLWQDGPKWAEFNVGSTISSYASATGNGSYWGEAPYTKENCGGHYGWGGTYDGADTENAFDWSDSIAVNSEGNLASQNDTAFKLWGVNWRMPTYSELQDLLSETKCTWTWMDGSTYQYVPGCKLTGWKVSGKGVYSANSIFLPSAGNFYNSHTNAKTWGFYWSSTLSGEDGRMLKLYEYEASGAVSKFDEGYSVRAVVN